MFWFYNWIILSWRMFWSQITSHCIAIRRISKFVWPSLRMYAVLNNCTFRATSLDQTSRLVRRLTGSAWFPTTQFAWLLPTRDFSIIQHSSTTLQQSSFLCLLRRLRPLLHKVHHRRLAIGRRYITWYSIFYHIDQSINNDIDRPSVYWLK